ncbi:hypothetical protein V2J09_016531 [Rumex salicifolius]
MRNCKAFTLQFPALQPKQPKDWISKHKASPPFAISLSLCKWKGKGKKLQWERKIQLAKWVEPEQLMDEKAVSESCLHQVDIEGNSMYPIYFGMVCSLFALKGLSEKEMYDEKWLDIKDKLLQGSAFLLGLLVWMVQRQEEKCKLAQKLDAAEGEIQELKKRRAEDGRANEKVVSIFAAQEQRWFGERKSLRQHIGSLINDLRILERRKYDEIWDLNKKLQEMELLLRTKNSVLVEEGKKKRDLEERLKTVESVVEELREASKKEAESHTSELWKHKFAFIELVSNQRQLEAELGRAHRRAETVKQQLEFVFEEKEESVFMLQKLSMELDKVRKDSEQKDKILSAMLRKSKLDTEEKQTLLKEIRVSKARMKQAETERWRINSKAKCERHTFKSILRKQVGSRLRARGNNKPDPNEIARDLIDLETESVADSPHSDDEDLIERDEELELSAHVKQLDGWVCLQGGKCRTAIEQRHQLELEAFSEQFRLKDEKLEAYHWRLMSMEVESKGLSSQIEGLSQSISQLRQNKLKLETSLVERETELKSLKDQIAMHLNSLNKQRSRLHSSRIEVPLGDDIVLSKVKSIKKKPADKELEAENSCLEVILQIEPEKDEATEHATEDSSKEFCEESVPACEETTSTMGVEITQKEVITNESLVKERSLWKMDVHALGVSYKIKRLKQQLLMLERLTGKQGGSEDQEQIRMKGFLHLLSLLNKQVTRYHSLQEKADDLSKRMREKDLNVKQGESKWLMRTKEDSRRLEQFLEETFQLQRFIVATGQKLMELLSKIESGFSAMADKLAGPTSFDTGRFSDSVQGLFREVQRGLEVRIARIIGDLEGTLACDGIRSTQQ